MPHTKNRLEISVATLQWSSDSIIHVHFKKDSTLGLAEQQELLIAHRQLAADIPHCVLYTAGEFVSVSPEARKKLRELETINCHLASAIVTRSFSYKVIANFYLKFSKPKKPVRIFSEENEATEWLKSFLSRASS